MGVAPLMERQFSRNACEAIAGEEKTRLTQRRFVYQATEKHDELKTAFFQRVASEGEMAGDIRFSLEVQYRCRERRLESAANVRVW